MLKEVEKWAEEFEMKFNKNKSVIMIHTKANRFVYKKEIEGLNKVEVTKILGY